MFKFKVNKSLQLNGDSSKPQEDFFNFSRIASFGFPHKPSALAWDSLLSLMAIGTQTGSIRVYGAPGVCFIGQHKDKVHIIDLVFVPGQGRVISRCADNSLHLWEFNTVDGKCEFTQVKSYTLSGLLKKITTVLLKSSSDILFLGTICGTIYTLDVDAFEMAETAIYQDVVMQNVPDHVKLNQGCVRAIAEEPGNADCLLIGYQQGLIALWDNKALVVVSIFVASQSLESLTWHRKGRRFMSSHSDGSYVVWSTDDPSKPAEVPMTPYGPFACKAIKKIFWKSVKGGDDYIIFNGGMPRTIHGEKSTLSIMCGEKHQVLDLSSKVVDFFTISDSSYDSDFDNPHSIVVLLEEELLALDLDSDEWLPYRLPYLDIPHSSPVSCMHYCPVVDANVSKLLLDICQNNCREIFSESEWPIKGGKSLLDLATIQSLLITGHENGCIKFWNIFPSSMQLLNTFHTSQIFTTYEKCDESDELEDWPPFRKIGCFDILSDDPRLAVRKIIFNDLAKTIVIGGTAGQILLFSLSEIEIDRDIKPIIIHLAGDYNAAVFSGHIPLMLRSGFKGYPKGFQLQALVQLTPAASVSALMFHSDWNILAAGTSHGFLLFDVIQKKCIMSKCTLGVGDALLPDIPSDEVFGRSQTLKRSLRESFRKLRRGRSLKQGRDRAGSLSGEIMKDMSRDNTLKRGSLPLCPDAALASSPSPELRSFASDSDSHQGESVLNSTVKCVYLAQSFIVNNVITTPTFWAGTSNGFIYIYTITLPASDSRRTDTIMCQLGKEIQLKHRAPVISIQIVDHRGYPLPDPVEVQHERVKPADLGRSHRVVICTEEQIKVFSLPSMKALCKYKITAMECCLSNQAAFATFPSKTDSKCTEHCVVCLLNTKEIALYSMPELRRQISFQYTSTDNVIVLPSFIFSRDGSMIYMTSPCELEMCSLSSLTSPFAQPVSSIEPLAGARDVKVPIESSIVLQVRDIVLEETTTRERQENGTMSENINDGVETIEEQSNHIEAENNQEALQQFRRAPLARIDELTLSDDHQANHSGHRHNNINN